MIPNVFRFESFVLVGEWIDHVNELYDVFACRGATNQAFDAKGNHLGPAAANPRYTWDQDNYLASADTNQDGTQDVEYEYDALGRRVKKTIDDDVTLYVSRQHPIQGRDRGQVLAEYEYTSGTGVSPVGNADILSASSPQLARKYVYGEYIDEPLMLITVSWAEKLKDPRDINSGTELTATETKYYYHHNANYNVAAMTDSSQTIKEQYRYTAYGQILTITTNNIGNPYNFTSRRYDPETGLYYNYGCYYDAIQGRRLNRDRLEYADSLNTYQWLTSSPLTQTDPTGLESCSNLGEIRVSAPASEPAPGRPRIGLTAGALSGNPDEEKIKLLGLAAAEAILIGSGPIETAVQGLASGTLGLSSAEFASLYKKILQMRAKIWIRVSCERCSCVGMWWWERLEWEETDFYWYECDLTKPSRIKVPPHQRRQQSINERYGNILGNADNNVMDLRAVGKKNAVRIVYGECRYQAVLEGKKKCK
jgi:RHS repeat-associated protein